ncbi:hypothetical protein ACOMHN_023831 [Nucella lapillus]
MSGDQSSGSVERYDSEKHANKLWRKMKEAPFVPVGIGGLIGAVSYGIWGYRNRGQMSTSVYIMHFRVIAQGMVVGAITIGIGANVGIKLWERYVSKPSDK